MIVRFVDKRYDNYYYYCCYHSQVRRESWSTVCSPRTVRVTCARSAVIFVIADVRYDRDRARSKNPIFPTSCSRCTFTRATFRTIASQHAFGFSPRNVLRLTHVFAYRPIRVHWYTGNHVRTTNVNVECPTLKTIPWQRFVTRRAVTITVVPRFVILINIDLPVTSSNLW